MLSRTWHVIAILAAILPWLVIGIAVFLMRPAYPRELYEGQYAQLDPGIRRWFRNQTSPKTGGNCCSEADGTYAEEDIRGGHYWTRFIARSANADDGEIVERATDWIEVPDDVVIHNPNRNGQPVAWWYWENGFKVRCYAPGGGA